jgi:hypothetical protein
MDLFTATMIAEGVEEADYERTREAWQLLVDTGAAWKLQGYFGRTAQSLIDQGIIKPAKDRPRFTDVHRTNTFDLDPRGRTKPTEGDNNG